MPKDMKLCLEGHGIIHRLTSPVNSHENGIVERTNRTLVELARSMLRSKSLPERFWAEALAVTDHVRNQVNTRGPPGNRTPYQVMFRRKPDLSYLKVFCCRFGYKANNAVSSKLDNKAEGAIMIGYARGASGYRPPDRKKGVVIVLRDVRFDECGFYGFGANNDDSLHLDVNSDAKAKTNKHSIDESRED